MIYPRGRSVLKFYEWFLLVIVIVGGIFTIIWLRSAITSLEYRIAELERIKLDALKEQKRLLAERASLTSVERIEELAFNKEGLHFPDRRHVHLIRRVDSPQVLSVAGSIRLDRLFHDDGFSR